jgi:CheY-like chemotaxis protein
MSSDYGVQPRSGKILVVDDERLLRTMICDGLEAMGHTATAATSGAEALRLSKADRPDCILLDIMMPDLDGYETCAAFKADAALAAIPILLISATTDVQVVDKAERAGSTGVLPKPIPMAELQHAVVLALSSAV